MITITGYFYLLLFHKNVIPLSGFYCTYISWQILDLTKGLKTAKNARINGMWQQALRLVATSRLHMGKTHALSEPTGPNQGCF